MAAAAAIIISISNCWLAGWRFQTLPRFFVVAWCPSSCATMQHSTRGLIYLHTPGEFRIPLVTLRGHFYCFAKGLIFTIRFVDVTALVCWWRGTPDNHGRTNVNISYLQRLNSVKKKKKKFETNKKMYGKTHVKNNFSYFSVTTNKMLSLQFRLYNRYHKLAYAIWKCQYRWWCRSSIGKSKSKMWEKNEHDAKRMLHL